MANLFHFDSAGKALAGALVEHESELSVPNCEIEQLVIIGDQKFSIKMIVNEVHE